MTPMGDLEAKIGIPSIEELLAERDELVKQAAPLWAKYGPGEVWTHIRKSTLSTLELLYRAKAADANPPEKMTDAIASAKAHDDERYTDLLTQAVKDRETLYLLQDRIDAVNQMIMRGNVVASYAKQEARL